MMVFGSGDVWGKMMVFGWFKGISMGMAEKSRGLFWCVETGGASLCKDSIMRDLSQMKDSEEVSTARITWG